MLKNNMVHIIGSDAHSIGRRNFCLKEAKYILKSNIDNDTLNIILDNPYKVISGEEIIPFEIIESPKPKFSRKIIDFFKKP